MLLTLSACKTTPTCPDRKGCSYEATDSSGKTSIVYQVHYDGLNVYNIGEPVKVNECMEIDIKGTKEYIINSEAKPIK